MLFQCFQADPIACITLFNKGLLLKASLSKRQRHSGKKKFSIFINNRG